MLSLHGIELTEFFWGKGVRFMDVIFVSRVGTPGCVYMFVYLLFSSPRIHCSTRSLEIVQRYSVIPEFVVIVRETRYRNHAQLRFPACIDARLHGRLGDARGSYIRAPRGRYMQGRRRLWDLPEHFQLQRDILPTWM